MTPPFDLFDDIAKHVPEQHLPEYWRVMARFRQLRPDDEILHIFLAMGVLTLILRDLPAALIEERKARQEQLDAFRAEMRQMVEDITRQNVAANNRSDLLSKTLEHNATLYCEASNRIEKASQEAVKQMNVDAMSGRLTAGIEEKVIVPFKAIAATISSERETLDNLLPKVERTIAVARRFHFWPTLGAIFVGILGLSLCLVAIGLKVINDDDKAALEEKLAQIQATADSNKEAFAELARYQIKTEVVNVSINGQKQYGQKALRLTPALDVGTDTPDGQPKRGVIYFAVPVTLQDQIEQVLGPH